MRPCSPGTIFYCMDYGFQNCGSARRKAPAGGASSAALGPPACLPPSELIMHSYFTSCFHGFCNVVQALHQLPKMALCRDD